MKPSPPSRLRLPDTFSLPLSVRLTLWYGLSLLLLLSLFAIFIYTSFHLSLHRDYDRHLAHEREQLLPYLRVTGSGVAFERLADLHGAAYHSSGLYGTYVRLRDPDGRTRYRTPNFADHSPLDLDVPRHAEVAVVGHTWDGHPARTHLTPLQSPDGRLQGWLEVTGFEWTKQQDLRRMQQVLVAGIALSLLLAVGGGYLLSRRALRPVVDLTAAARHIRATDLSARLPVGARVRDELTELAETFNGMMDRLEASFHRERRFTANAAHELLTPLATLKNELDITLRRPRTPDEYADVVRRLQVDVDEMTAMVRSLLQLSRVEQTDASDAETLDFGALVAHQAARWRPRAEAKGLSFDVRAEPGVYVRAGAVRLGEVVSNLFENAVKYTPAGGRVEARVGAEGSVARLVVRDSGIGFPVEQAARLFDRFFRVDAPEVQAEAGSGLGLAIVEAIVRQTGGRVTATSDGPGRGSTFEVALPLRREPPPT